MPRLRRADCSSPGIHRVRRGESFAYERADGAEVDGPAELARIEALVIPPAWRDVWICPHADGHLQATGTDAAGRKQYRYHAEWRTRRDQAKFDEMTRFARALPGLRTQVARELAATSALSRERVLACAVRLLDRGFFRIGSEDYAERNETYGLATIRKGHATLGDDGSVVFDYVAKSGKQRIQAIVDPDVHEILARLKRRRGGGEELLAYKVGREWRDIRSTDINSYLKDATRTDHSAKDFRTWNATVLAALALAVSGQAAGSESSRKRAKARAVKEVAGYLGNTPAVCRASYIDPRVFDAYDAGLTIGGVLLELGDDPDGVGELAIHQPAVEAAVLDLVDGASHDQAAGLELVA